MAENVSINCKILGFKPAPYEKGQIAIVEFSLGHRVWTKEIGLDFDRPISFEEFKEDLKKHVWLKNESDNLRYVKEVGSKPFKITVERKN